MSTTGLRAIALACTLMTAGAGNAWADQAMDKRIDELERQIKVLAEELGRVKEAQVIPVMGMVTRSSVIVDTVYLLSPSE